MEAIPRPPNPCPDDMKNTEVHPIELALVAGLVVLEAVVVLVAAVVALVVTLAQWRPAAAPAPVAEPEPIKYPSSTHQVAQPQLHPLALIATQLQALPVASLREMAGVRSKAIRKAQLIELIACS